jgi:hypothetical protein
MSVSGRIIEDGKIEARECDAPSGNCGMIPPGKTELYPATNAIQSLIVVMGAGRRQIALLHNTPAAFHGRPHLVERLTEELAETTRAGHVVANAAETGPPPS